jgi:hypothetical protein
VSHYFEFIVRVELSRESGKFASRDEMADQIRDALEVADPGYVSGIGSDGDSEYIVDSWDAEER